MPRKLKIDTSKIMIWQKWDSVSGEYLIGIELPKSIKKDQRLRLAYNIGYLIGSHKYTPTIRFTRLFKGELVKLIKLNDEPLFTYNAIFKAIESLYLKNIN